MTRFLVVAHREDEAAEAIIKAVELAERQSAELHVLAFCHADIDQVSGFAAKQLDEVKQKLIEKKHAWLQNELTQFSDFKGKMTSEVIWQKDIYKSILREAQTNDYDMIITQRHRTESFFHVPTEWYLLRESSIPVYIAHEDRWKVSQNIVVAVDLQNTSAEGLLMQRNVLDSAQEFSQSVDGNLHLCFCMDMPEILLDLDIIDERKYQQDALKKYQPMLHKLADDYGIAHDCTHVKFGLTEKAVASVATKAKAQVVVIGSMARKGIKGKLIGNTAEKLASFLHTDLLIVPPQ